MKDKYGVNKAFYFIRYVNDNQKVYTYLQEAGYVLIFKPTLEINRDEKKGNCDADLVLRAMIEYDSYDKAVIVSSDGDFYSLVEYLYEQDKLRTVLSPDRRSSSRLLRKKGKEKMFFIEDLENKVRM